MPRLLDLFCGRWGWSRAFAARGWECVGVDLVDPPNVPTGCQFERQNVILLTARWIKDRDFDFIVASSPCEQFSVHGLKHFHKNPPYPELGIALFNHTRSLCEAVDLPYVMENVRAAQQFVGSANHHCGPFYLWGNAVPPLLHRGISKGTKFGRPRAERRFIDPSYKTGAGSQARKDYTAQLATIPPELANCVADYAERLLELRRESSSAVLAQSIQIHQSP